MTGATHEALPPNGAARNVIASARVRAGTLPGPLAALVIVLYLGGSQGGYFPTTWGWTITVCAAVLLTWLATGAVTDATGRDAALLAALALLAGWTTISTAWSAAPANSLIEGQRVLVVLFCLAVVLVLATRGCETDLAFAVMAGITLVTGHGLLTRLVPTLSGSGLDLSDGYRLAGPLGYWNGLGAFAAIGILLALGLAMSTRSLAGRITASMALVVLAPSLYYTFSRGSVLALGFGICVMLAVSPRRLATLGSIAFLLPAPLAAVAVGSHFYGLTNQSATLAEVNRDGRAMLFWLVGLGAIAALAAVALTAAERRVRLGRRARTLVGSVVVAVAIVGVAAALAAAGGPRTIAERLGDAFATNQSVEVDLSDHFTSFSGSGRVALWRVAASAYRDNPVTGIGAGSYERYWLRDDDAVFKARDAHSLYLETLTELGPIGLVILLVGFGIVVASAIASRRTAIVPAGLGAFAVYAVHAGIEWDWELTGLTLAALFAGSTGLIALRRPTMTRLRGPIRLALGLVVVVVAGAALVGWVGNRALESSRDALAERRASTAVQHAVTAERWTPWSPYPLTVRGEALLRLGDQEAARRAFQDAISLDAGYWRAWLGLAVASTGGDRASALERASALYRHSSEIYETTQLLKR